MASTPSQAALDLCWAVNSPSLVEGSDVALTPDIAVDAIDQEHLTRFLEVQNPGHRVGRYFEQLIHYWLLHIRKVEVVANGLQLKDGKITVGEIDFLYEDESATLVHCETSVKFFLCAPGTTPSEFPGPNARDNFEAKTTKLFDKQLPASAGRIEGIGSRHGLVKGMIFYRDDEPTAASPERLASDHLRGTWLRVNETVKLRSRDRRFAVAPKPHWLAPQSQVGLLDSDAMITKIHEHFAGPGHPVMVSVRNNDDGEELDRVFVVPDEWPGDTD